MSSFQEPFYWNSYIDSSNNSVVSVGNGGLVLSNTIDSSTNVVSFTAQGVYTSSNDITTPYANITQLSIALANIIPDPPEETFGASDTIVVQDTQGVNLAPTESISISTSNRRLGYTGGYTGGYFGLNYDSSGNVDFSIQTPGTGNIVINQVSTGGTGGVNPITIIPTTGYIIATKFIGDLSGNSFSTTNIQGGTGGSIPYQSSTNTTSLLANGTAGQVLTSAGTTLAPTWSTLLAGPTGATGDIGIQGGTGPTGSKTFVINHPKDINRYLVHACLEGPEAGVYYRGKGEIINNICTTIVLPDYVENLISEFTIQVTPIYSDKKIEQIYVSEVINNSFNVYGENCKFYWVVQGKRIDIEVEPLKITTQIKGSGPYTWI